MPAHPQEVIAVFGALVDDLLRLGWSISGADYSSQAFGNITVDLSKNGMWLRLTRDRGDLMLEGPDLSLIQGAGLSRAFRNGEEFRNEVLTFVERCAV